LFNKGFRYRLHQASLPGKPDIVLAKWKTVIFVHGCFWHGHENCKLYRAPKTRTQWWVSKIGANKKRDHKNEISLKKLGWKIIIIWACKLSTQKQDQTLRKVTGKLNKIKNQK
jgi:DNA mismatch endonuclease (patch repair protein)